ncbi:MAG: hypothetical protein OXI59_19710, partial [Gemmatimonadota bacterium]|nr:hypothetical protein [Gemmatimonadota bacterium]
MPSPLSPEQLDDLMSRDDRINELNSEFNELRSKAEAEFKIFNGRPASDPGVQAALEKYDHLAKQLEQIDSKRSELYRIDREIVLDQLVPDRLDGPPPTGRMHADSLREKPVEWTKSGSDWEAEIECRALMNHTPPQGSGVRSSRAMPQGREVWQEPPELPSMEWLGMIPRVQLAGGSGDSAGSGFSLKISDLKHDVIADGASPAESGSGVPSQHTAKYRASLVQL